jgi:nitroreductase
LQVAYLILAARALGLDAGPMSGFDNAKLDEAFFAGTPIRSPTFLVNLGKGDPASIFPRSPRLPFDEACQHPLIQERDEQRLPLATLSLGVLRCPPSRIAS